MSNQTHWNNVMKFVAIDDLFTLDGWLRANLPVMDKYTDGIFKVLY